MLIARTQTLVQLTPELLEALDDYRARTGAGSRSAIIREAISKLLAEDRQRELDRQIVEAYEATPATDVWGDAGARILIESEPWE